MTGIEDTNDFRRVLNESARLLRQNRAKEALALLQPLYKETPTQPDLAINLGGAYILQRKWNRAVDVLRKAVEANPENVMLWTNLAAAHMGNLETAGPKHQARAIAAYERVLALDPQAPNVHYHLGLIYKEQGDLETAGRFFQQALEANPADRDARYWLEQIALQHSMNVEARQQDDLQGAAQDNGLDFGEPDRGKGA
jgi:tetratricopeptide (TPR) repeat protein